MNLSLSPCLSWAGANSAGQGCIKQLLWERCQSEVFALGLVCSGFLGFFWLFFCFGFFNYYFLFVFCGFLRDKAKFLEEISPVIFFPHQHPLPSHKAEGSLFSRCLHLHPCLASEPVNPQGGILSCHSRVCALEQELARLSALPEQPGLFALAALPG